MSERAVAGGSRLQRLPTQFSIGVVDKDRIRRSLIWKFDIRKKDVYLAPGLKFGSPEPSFAHISLHADGRCHHVFDNKYFEREGQKRTAMADRKMSRWKRTNTPKLGFSFAFSIVVLPTPHGVIGPLDDNILDFSYSAPAKGRIREFLLGYSYLHPESVSIEDGQIIGYRELSTGEIFYLITTENDFDPRTMTLPNGGQGALLQDLEGGKFPEFMRVVMFATRNENHAYGFDAAVASDPQNSTNFQILIAT